MCACALQAITLLNIGQAYPCQVVPTTLGLGFKTHPEVMHTENQEE